MKTIRNSFKPLLAFVAVLGVIVGAIAVHPVVLLALVFDPMGFAPLGATSTAMNPQTSTGILSFAANNREQAWAKKITLGAMTENVFSDDMIGTPGSGKAFIDHTDTRKIRGNTIFISDVLHLGGQGSQGEEERNGREEKIDGGEQQLTVGRQHYSMGSTTIAQAETLIGSQWDKINSPLLEQRVGLKKSTDMQMVLRESAGSENRVYPNSKNSIATLKTADSFQTSVITKAGLRLSGNGAKPARILKSAQHGVVEGYTFSGSLDSISALYLDPTYESVVKEIGAGNGILTGKFSDWNGHIIHPLQIRLAGTKGSVGSPMLRRAFLGEEIEAADTTVNGGEIKGGGVKYDAAYHYFESFSGYPYKLTNGLAPNLAGTVQDGTIKTGVGSGPWYVAMIDKTTGKYALFSYTGNTGNKLTGVKRLGTTGTGNVVATLSGSSMAYSTSAYNPTSQPITTAAGGGSLGLIAEDVAVAQGSLIVEVNALGVPFADTFGLGEEAGIVGYGFVPGAGTPFGRRTKQVGDHEKDVAIGYEFSFGTAARKNGDGFPANYVRITHAVQVDGMPSVA